MKSSSTVNYRRYFLFFFIAGIFAFSTNISHLILDSNFLFHEGEYVGSLWSIRSFYIGESLFPLLIHGAMDYIPSIIASFIYGDDRIIVGVRGINTVIVWVCWVFFLDLCYSISLKSNRFLWGAIAFVVFIFLAPVFRSQALIVQMSFLGVRDLFVILTVWCFVQYTTSVNLLRTRILLILGTISAVTALFWSYDRGIMTLSFLSVIFVGMLVNKKYFDVALSILTACLFLLTLESVNIFGSLASNLYNIIYWIKNSAEVFGAYNSVDKRSLIIVTLLILLLMATIFIAFTERFYKDKENLFLTIGIFMIQIVLFKTIMNAPEMPRLAWFIWPSILLLIYFSSRKMMDFRLDYKLSFSRTIPISVIYKIYFLIFAICICSISSVFYVYGSFFKNLVNPKLDIEIVSKEVNELGDLLRKNNDACVLGWVNEGVIALMSKKRSCTQSPYAVYVSKSEELKYLQQIKNDPPAAVVFDVGGDNVMFVHGIHMESRLPNVNKYIQDNYPNKQQVGRYIVLSK